MAEETTLDDIVKGARPIPPSQDIAAERARAQRLTKQQGGTSLDDIVANSITKQNRDRAKEIKDRRFRQVNNLLGHVKNITGQTELGEPGLDEPFLRGLIQFGENPEEKLNILQKKFPDAEIRVVPRDPNNNAPGGTLIRLSPDQPYFELDHPDFEPLADSLEVLIPILPELIGETAAVAAGGPAAPALGATKIVKAINFLRNSPSIRAATGAGAGATAEEIGEQAIGVADQSALSAAGDVTVEAATAGLGGLVARLFTKKSFSADEVKEDLAQFLQESGIELPSVGVLTDNKLLETLGKQSAAINQTIPNHDLAVLTGLMMLARDKGAPLAVDDLPRLLDTTLASEKANLVTKLQKEVRASKKGTRRPSVQPRTGRTETIDELFDESVAQAGRKAFFADDLGQKLDVQIRAWEKKTQASVSALYRRAEDAIPVNTRGNARLAVDYDLDAINRDAARVWGEVAKFAEAGDSEARVVQRVAQEIWDINQRQKSKRVQQRYLNVLPTRDIDGTERVVPAIEGLQAWQNDLAEIAFNVGPDKPSNNLVASRARQLYYMLKDVVDNPAGFGQGQVDINSAAGKRFRDRYALARQKASERFTEIKRMHNLKALAQGVQSGNAPEVVVAQMADLSRADNAILWRDAKKVLPQQDFRKLQLLTMDELIADPGRLNQMLLNARPENLNLALTKQDIFSLKSFAEGFEKLKKAGFQEAREAEDQAGRLIANLVNSSRGSAAMSEMVRIVNKHGGREGALGSSMRRAVFQHLFGARKMADGTLAPGAATNLNKGRLELNAQALKDFMGRMQETGAIGLLTPEDIRLLNNTAKLSDFMRATSDAGVSLQRAEAAANLRGALTGQGEAGAKGLLTIIENMGIGYLFTTNVGRKMFLGSLKSEREAGVVVKLVGGADRYNTILRAMGAQMATTAKEMSEQGDLVGFMLDSLEEMAVATIRFMKNIGGSINEQADQPRQ